MQRAPDTLDTDRLLLRRWRPADGRPFAAINADPEVMRHISSGPLDRARSDDMLRRMERDWSLHGHGLWALERREDRRLLGFSGLAVPPFRPRLLPAAEIGWRLRRDAWGQGYAFEASLAVLDVAWDTLGMAQLVALVHPDNERSMALAERLEMRVTGTRRHAGIAADVLVLALRRPPAAGGRVRGGP